MRRDQIMLGGMLAAGLLGGVTVDARSPGQEPGPVARGRTVYVEQRCNLCHSVDGDGDERGPLDGVGQRLTTEEIRRWIVTPREMTEETNATRRPLMRAYPDLPADDLAALVAYMVSLD